MKLQTQNTNAKRVVAKKLHVVAILTKLPTWPLISEEYSIFRNSQRRCSLNKAVFKDFAIFTGKQLCWSHFLRQACKFIENGLQHNCFPVNIAKFLRTVTLKNICKRLPLNIDESFCLFTVSLQPSNVVQK